ncbi:hypothetical protein [Cellvibrio japonicus]|uniref:MSHA biogenesis protein MshI n=1 Tax=Cellvibrio japonicus (strain Ueda107) TaxID=498211 RepID=B3PKD2_CELJU|nr:hypothetical protein [Cellvibrio japonicus]ACE85124.1 MSHA biogenesis protein MshI [Cellvibrio japonicus Ueda107]QEI12803.1 MSHA biogenesis protein MshI [Cellvibrio japonicus]QEI16377.1 MSHA biogenesis protein MshI [Cellvibrio japonicus]QEI19955.1 MSHA biogenesis protein MshI [Cellvibrio japonicus]
MQQINLYLPEFQPNREPLRAIHMFWISLAFVVLLILASILSHRYNLSLVHEAGQQRVQLEQIKQQVDQLRRNQPQVDLAVLDAHILKTHTELERRERLVMLVSSRSLGNSTGFSAQLEAMSRQSNDRFSLSVFSLTRGGAYAEMLGKTRAGEEIPLYVQRLRTEPSFVGTAFGILQLSPDEQAGDTFDFSLAEPLPDTGVRSAEKTAVQHLLELNEKMRGQRP